MCTKLFTRVLIVATLFIACSCGEKSEAFINEGTEDQAQLVTKADSLSAEAFPSIGDYLEELVRLNKETEKQRQKTSTAVFVALLIGVLSIIAIVSMLYALKVRKRSQNEMHKMVHDRQQFYIYVTHELRTPLTIINGITQRMRGKFDKDSECATNLSVIQNQVDNLRQLVDNLLDMSKISSPLGDPVWKTGNVNMMLQMIVDTMRQYGSQHLVDIHYTIDSTEIEMDFVPSYMTKIFSNLLSNAVKYSPRGGTVNVDVRHDEKNIYAEILDHGIGIKKKDVPHVMELFYQVEGNDMSGTGVGLCLTKQMVDAMKGEIRYDSEYGHWTKVSVTFPIKNGASAYPSWQPNSESMNPILVSQTAKIQSALGEDAKTVLIVEDNDEVSRFISEILMGQYKLLYARNGQEALEKTCEFMPDIVVTDVMMPVMDGYTLCQRIRGMRAVNHVPIIIISALGAEEDRIKGLKAGADAFLSKPFNPDELLILIEKELDKKAKIIEKYSTALKSGTEDSVDIPDKEKEFMSGLNSIIFSNMENTALNSEGIADALHFSQRQLNRKVKAITGIDTTTYIRKARMSSARKMLLSTNLSIGEIVGKCGFDSASYFSKLYKQEYGETPSQTRKGNSELLTGNTRKTL